MNNLNDLLKHPILSEIPQTKVPFLGFDDSGWFETKTYYLLEIDQDGDAKIIDSGVIKERLEAKAERYNELAKKDKLFYWNTVRTIYDNWQKDILFSFPNFEEKHLVLPLPDKFYPDQKKFQSLEYLSRRKLR